MLIVRVDEAPVGFGLKEGVAPEGSPEVLSDTVAANPPLGVIVTE